MELAVPLLERAYALTYPPPVAGLLTRLRREVNSRAEFGSNVIPSLSGALLEAAQELPPALQLQLQADLAELEGARRMFTSAWERCQAALQRDPCQRRLLLLGAHALQRGLDGLSAEGRLAPRWRPVQRELFARYLLLCRPEALHHYLRLTEDLRKDQRRGW